jgi:hypothetical protein
MHRDHAVKLVHHLWDNHLRLARQVDIESMPEPALDRVVREELRVGPFQIATWLARQSFIMAAWALWDYYSRLYRNELPTLVAERKQDSCVDLVERSFSANGIPFAKHDWFAGANAYRNLLAHHGGRVTPGRAANLLEQAKGAFPKVAAAPNGYVEIERDHVSEFQVQIENFILDCPPLSK